MAVDREQLLVESREQWRGWLVEHADTSPGVWLVRWKKASGRPQVSYDEVVEEALAHGWVDSLPRALDDAQSMLLVSPRKPGSSWSRPNQQRVARLEAAGLMHPRGAAVVEAARADGSWSRLDAVEDLVEPDDLRAALDAVPAARASWDGFPRSVKRGILEWISTARTAPTRAARIEETASEAAAGRRAHQWRG